MNPKPQTQPKTRRPKKGKPVTVCIAGIHEENSGQSSIILICDRRLSLFGGWFSQDGNAKYTLVHRDWIGMFAGSVEETNLMLKEVNSSLADLRAVPFEKVVDRSRLAYAKVRKRLIETQILPDFDVETYKKYKALRRTNEALYLTIQQEIVQAEEEWNLLFAGFDDRRRPHVFVISGAGKVQYCDSQKYAVIGSGAFAAIVWLSFYGYQSRRPVGELLFGALSAKFFSERARDVGYKTVATLIRSNIPALLHFGQEEIREVRKAWDALPKLEPSSVKQLEERMQQTYRMMTSAGFSTQQSASQKSVPEK